MRLAASPPGPACVRATTSQPASTARDDAEGSKWLRAYLRQAAKTAGRSKATNLAATTSSGVANHNSTSVPTTSRGAILATTTRAGSSGNCAALGYRHPSTHGGGCIAHLHFHLRRRLANPISPELGNPCGAVLAAANR